ncbi:MAG: hypothetical protein ACPHLK_02700 [Gammaproteobacteria bacterium]|jgi:hypothetical protein
MKKIHIIFFFTIYLLLFGCDVINTQSKTMCRNIYSNIKDISENIFLPELTAINSFDSYSIFIKKHYNFIKSNDVNFRECMSDSRFVVNNDELSKWTNAGASLSFLEMYWKSFLEKTNDSDQSEIEIFIQKDLYVIKKIIKS